MTALLSTLYGRKAFLFQTLKFPVGTQQDGHSDMVHFSCIPERFMCGVWLAMEDIHPDAGPLPYYPGSHRWPVMSNALIRRREYETSLNSAQDFFADAGRALCAAHGARPSTFLARKGQALIWCANLLHDGSAQADTRRIASIADSALRPKAYQGQPVDEVFAPSSSSHVGSTGKPGSFGSKVRRALRRAL